MADKLMNAGQMARNAISMGHTPGRVRNAAAELRAFIQEGIRLEDMIDRLSPHPGVFGAVLREGRSLMEREAQGWEEIADLMDKILAGGK